MSTIDLDNKRLALLGLGLEHRALATYLSAEGLSFSVCDEREADAVARPESVEGSGFAVDEWRFGRGYLDEMEDFDLVFRTPGLPALHPKLEAARRSGVEVSSQTALFFDRCPAPILGITGTKGKGTTASLVALMLNGNSPFAHVELGGNIGRPPIEFLNQMTPQDLAVLELSSFQLQDLPYSPSIAVVLNLLTDHLDYHENRSEYVDAKASILRHQHPDDCLIVNADSQEVATFAAGSPAQRLSFSIEAEVEAGSWVEDEAIWHRSPDGHRERVCDLDGITLRGPHNLTNAVAAVTAAKAAGGSTDGVARALSEFAGLPHRLQKIARIQGVTFYDDSAATMPDASIAAIRSFEAPILLIAGGASKGADFGDLARVIASSSVRVLILLGEEGERLVLELDKTSFSGEIVVVDGAMENAVAAARQRARRGDVVLLSPGCASFGLFDNYVARGIAFAELVSGD
jgi:UDP-N-acetylmuramoylalanine--D-glutamate ligase